LVDPEQGPHAAPPVPQVLAPWLAGGTQVPALQHPVGQLAASHTQAPPTQRWPAEHAAPEPHAQAPFAQRSAVALQAVQVLPAVPHDAVVTGVTHALPLQQPLGQLVALQTQAPPTHCWPAPQAAFAPQRQVPAPQPSALGAVQEAQAAPPTPQVAATDCLHTPPLQQPPGQEVESQPLQALSPVQVPGQTWQASPPEPQVAAVSPVAQVLLVVQHPFGQLAGLQTHAPATHCCPTPHAALEPHLHAPFAQLSDRNGSQALQVEPAAPHSAVVGEVQARPSQHPSGQLMTSHTHRPEAQR
jgi:hypothetical protein